MGDWGKPVTHRAAHYVSLYIQLSKWLSIFLSIHLLINLSIFLSIKVFKYLFIAFLLQNYSSKLYSDYLVDSKRFGNKAKFVNHSSDPNVIPMIMKVRHIVHFLNRRRVFNFILCVCMCVRACVSVCLCAYVCMFMCVHVFVTVCMCESVYVFYNNFCCKFLN